MWYKVRVQLHPSACGYPVFSAVLFKGLFFHWVVLAVLSKIILPYIWGFISGLSILFHWSIFMPVSHCFDYYSFVVSFEIMKYESSNFILLFQFFFFFLATQNTLRSHLNFNGFLKYHWDFDRNFIESVACLG